MASQSNGYTTILEKIILKKLYLGNLSEILQGRIMAEDSERRKFQLFFPKTPDYIHIQNKANVEVSLGEVGLFKILGDSDKISSIKKNAEGWANHLEFIHYLLISDKFIINIISQDEIQIKEYS